MSDAGKPEYVPDHLYERLFTPWVLPESEWPLCKEDWARVDAVTALPWTGWVLDFGSGDGTLAAMVRARNPLVSGVQLVEKDDEQRVLAYNRWLDWVCNKTEPPHEYDGALCCEVLEHMTPEEGHQVLCNIKRVLKPGGMLCVTVPNQAGPRATYPGHIREFTVAELARTITDAGFTVKDGDAIGGKIIPVWFMAVARA
jgi:2-polyprenyl-3-methyl-5-hydroxy-6-metoxy-1,4-benzoquinol methylase